MKKIIIIASLIAGFLIGIYVGGYLYYKNYHVQKLVIITLKENRFEVFNSIIKNSSGMWSYASTIDDFQLRRASDISDGSIALDSALGKHFYGLCRSIPGKVGNPQVESSLMILPDSQIIFFKDSTGKTNQYEFNTASAFIK
jgi:hypothetical protein